MFNRYKSSAKEGATEEPRSLRVDPRSGELQKIFTTEFSGRKSTMLFAMLT